MKSKNEVLGHIQTKSRICATVAGAVNKALVTLHSRCYLNSIHPDEAPSKSEYDNLSLFAKPYRLFFFF